MRSAHLHRLAVLAPLFLGAAARLGVESCPPLPPPTGSVVTVSSVSGLLANRIRARSTQRRSHEVTRVKLYLAANDLDLAERLLAGHRPRHGRWLVSSWVSTYRDDGMRSLWLR